MWLRIQGQFPSSGKLKLDHKPWGEWRADANQTVVYGKHPSGCEYRNNGKKPLEIKFEKIRWPVACSNHGKRTRRNMRQRFPKAITPRMTQAGRR